MKIVEYLLGPYDSGKTPSWIDDGGHFVNPADSTMVGATTHKKIPQEINILTAEQLEDRQVAIHSVTPMIKYPDEPGGATSEMTESEVSTAVQNWVASRETERKYL